MSDVLRDLRVRVAVDSASVGPGLAAIRSQVNATTQQIDALARASVAPDPRPTPTNNAAAQQATLANLAAASSVGELNAAEQRRLAEFQARVQLEKASIDSLLAKRAELSAKRIDLVQQLQAASNSPANTRGTTSEPFKPADARSLFGVGGTDAERAALSAKTLAEAKQGFDQAAKSAQGSYAALIAKVDAEQGQIDQSLAQHLQRRTVIEGQIASVSEESARRQIAAGAQVSAALTRQPEAQSISTVPTAVSAQVAKFSAADQAAFANLRTTALAVQAQILASSTALDSALASKDLVGVRKADRDLTTLRRVLGQSEIEMRGLFVKNLDLAPVAAVAEAQGLAAGARFGSGVERGLIRVGARALGVGRLFVNGSVATLAGFLAVTEIQQQFEQAAKATQKLIDGLAALRAASGLGVQGTAQLAAEAQAAGVDIGSLADAIKAVRGSGLSFDQARAQISSIEDPTLRAAAAQRLLGDAAKGVVPLFTAEGAAAKASADQIDRLTHLQQIGALGKVLQQQQTPVLGGVAEFFNEQGTRLNLALQRSQARADAIAATRKAHPELARGTFDAAPSPELAALETKAANEAEAAFDAKTRAVLAGNDAADAATARQAELTRQETAGTKALADIAKGTDEFARAMAGADIATDKLGASLQRLPVSLDVATAFDQLKTAGVLGPATDQAIGIVRRLSIVGVDLNEADILRTFEKLGDLSGATMSDHIRAVLEKQLIDLDTTTNIDPLKRELEERESATQRIADLEQDIADRHKESAKLSFDFSKAELDQKLKDREAEHAFFSFREKPGATDTAKQDARDQREIDKLRKQIADSHIEHPNLEQELADELAKREALKRSFIPRKPETPAASDDRESAVFGSIEKLFAAAQAKFDADVRESEAFKNVERLFLAGGGGTSPEQQPDTPPNSRDLGLTAEQARDVAARGAMIHRLNGDQTQPPPQEVTLHHQIQFGTDGQIVVLSAQDAGNADLLLKLFGPTIGKLLVDAVSGAQRTVDNTRPEIGIVPVGQGGMR